jgi:hypothetical protein
MIPSPESKRIERLVRLCKLWGAVKYFHPYLAYRDDIDWDAALVAAIPKVSATRDAGDYAAAVQDMLAALGDPVTRVAQREPVDTVAPPHERQPSYTFTPDGILVVTVHHYKDLSDFSGARQKIAAIKVEIPKARGVLFDLRAATPVSYEMRMTMLIVFQSSEIASVLSSTPLTTAGERTRMHIGLAPVGGGGFLYTSAFQIADGHRVSPAPEARDIPTVFLINGWTALPPEALALQVAGKAAIVVEGSASDASLGVKTHSIPLGDGAVAKIRLGEIISEDGAGGFLPDRVIPPAQTPGEGDPALDAALELLKDFKPSETRRTPLPTHAAPLPENAYPEMAFPPLEYRLLAAFRIWTAIHYFFPYKDLIEEDWDDVLVEFIPRMEQADSALSYHLAVAEMMTHIHDLHGEVSSLVLDQHFGSAQPPIRVQIVKDAPVITVILDEESAKAAGVHLGDVVLKIDGEDATERIAEWAKYTPASTPHSLMHGAALSSLAGPDDSLAILTVRDREQRVKEVELP